MDRQGCEACRFLLREDHGYSNWTVMGTVTTCLKDVNPNMPCDDDHVGGTEAQRQALAYGETCEAREAGDYIWIDCDGEESDAIKANPSHVLDDVRPLLWRHFGWDE